MYSYPDSPPGLPQSQSCAAPDTQHVPEKGLCIVHANCQGEVLQGILEQSPSFSRFFTIHRYTNYIREPVPDADLDTCSLFLYQHLGPEWEELSSEHLIQHLPPSCQVIRIPNLFFKGYWPFWTTSPEIDFADSLLEKLLSLGLDTEQILTLYLNGQHSAFCSLSSIASASLKQEYAKEAGTPVPCAPVIEEFWRTEPLFYTVNHPARRLSLHVAQSLLGLLDLPALSPAFCASYRHPDADFCLPVHPVVGEQLRLPFTGPDVRYPAFGREITHREFVLAYLACRMNHFRNISAFLYDRGTGSDTGT